MSFSAQHVLLRMDGADADAVVRAGSTHRDQVAGFVVGADLLVDRGPLLVGALAAFDKPVLADLAILDRPAVLERAVARMGKLGARWVSLSGLAGREAILAAVAEAERYPPLSVVVSAAQASWAEDHDLKGVGISDTPGSHVSRLTKLALKTGAGGVLFPSRELGVVVQVSNARRRADNDQTGGLARIAEVPEGLSWTDMEATVRDGADWVVATLGQVQQLEQGA